MVLFLTPPLLVCLLLVGGVLGQQYAGQTFPIILPDVTGAHKEFFNIRDNTGGNVTLGNYYSSVNGTRLDEKGVSAHLGSRTISFPCNLNIGS